MGVKSERINALRKQYDIFLEDDIKRKERNEYILGRLDKMSTSDNSVVRYRDPVSVKVDHPVLLNNYPCRNDFELQRFRRNYSVEPPLRTVDEIDLLRAISKKYILIPKRDQRADEPTEFRHQIVTPVQDNNWKSKYDILNELKMREKLSNDHVGLSPKNYDHARNTEFEAEYETVSEQRCPRSHNSKLLVTAIDPNITDQDTSNNQVDESAITGEFSACRDILKPVEKLSIAVIDDTSKTYSDPLYDQTIKNLNNAYRPSEEEHFQQPISKSDQVELIRSDQNIRRPQAYQEFETIKDNVLERNNPEESEANDIEITKFVNNVESLYEVGEEVQNPKEIINQEYPLFDENPDYSINATLPEVASVHQDVLVHSSEYTADVTDIVQDEYYQEQPKSIPTTDPEQVYKYGAEMAPLDKGHEESLYTQETNEQNCELEQQESVDNFNVAQIDNPNNYDHSAKKEHAYDEYVHNVNYEHDVNYDPNLQDVNYDQHTVLARDEFLNYEQTPQDQTNELSANNTDYNQNGHDGPYEGDGQQNYTDDQNYAHTENYPDKSQPVEKDYDQTYPVDGVYHPDGSYSTEQPFDHGVDQNYANVQNQPVVYDQDITQQQYDQTYAEQYSAEQQPDVFYEQPQQYHQEYEQVYDQYQQHVPDTVEDVQKQLDKEDGYVEQSPAAEAKEKDTVLEETAPVTIA